MLHPARLTSLLLLLPAAAAATEAIVQVTTLVDSVAGDGLCSLREAMETANTGAAVDGCTIEGAGDRVVLLGEGTHRLTIEGPYDDLNASSDLYVTSTVTVRGAGAHLTTIDAGGLFRLFSVHSVGDLTVEHLKLTGGHAGENTGGAIYSHGPLQLSDVILEGNAAHRGGAVFALAAPIVMRRALVQDNVATLVSGGVELAGGALLSSLIESSTFAGNEAGTAGGLYSTHPLVIRQSTFSGNTATGSSPGAGIFNQGTMSLDAVLVIGTVGTGSAVFNNGGQPPLRVNNSVFVDNQVPPGGVFESHGVNYVESTHVFPFTGPDDIVVSPDGEPMPGLRALGLYGGKTPVHAATGASALVGLSSCLDLDGAPYGVDQRGAPRPATGCTVGPVEHGAFGIVTRAAIATADQCPHGGVVVHSGEDNGHLGVAGDRLLSDGEIDHSDVSCHAPGALVSVTDEAPGLNCEAGGQRIDTGLDLDASGALDASEIQQTRYVCHPLPPAPVLFDVVDFTESEKCPAGGQRLITGVDADRDGLLDEEEIASQVETCHGVDGKDGSDGTDGSDGLDGQNGADGKDGLDGKDGKDGLNGKDAEGGCAAVGAGSLALLALALRRRK